MKSKPCKGDQGLLHLKRYLRQGQTSKSTYIVTARIGSEINFEWKSSEVLDNFRNFDPDPTFKYSNQLKLKKKLACFSLYKRKIKRKLIILVNDTVFQKIHLILGGGEAHIFYFPFPLSGSSVE